MKRGLCIALFTVALACGQTPVVDCVMRNPATSTFVAYFGYINNLGGPVTIPLGANNSVIGLQTYGSVPTVFGSQAGHTLFSVQFVSTAAWTLNGSTATANSSSVSSPICQVAVNNSTAAGAANRCWMTQGAGNTCTQSEDVDGDGFCTILDCTGAIGPQGAPGPTGPQGSPGPSGPPASAPILKTYSTNPGTANATASCGANEFLVTGGGACTVPNLANMGRVATSSPTGNGLGWTVSCNAGQATAVAVCAPEQN